MSIVFRYSKYWGKCARFLKRKCLIITERKDGVESRLTKNLRKIDKTLLFYVKHSWM